MNIKNKEPIQAALDSLEMALEHLEDQEEYTLNDVSIKDLWDIHFLYYNEKNKIFKIEERIDTLHLAEGNVGPRI